MGCTASTPSPAQRRYDPEPVVKEQFPPESQTLFSEIPHDVEKPLSTPTSSATSLATSQADMTLQARQASSTKLMEIPTMPEQPQPRKQVEFQMNVPGEKPARPPMREEEQPPMKRIPNPENDRSLIIPKLNAAGAGDAPELNPSRKLEDFYDVDRQKRIGKGHYASVFIGINRETGQRVAVKMIEKRLSKTERLALEVNVMRKAGAHPHIVQLLDVFETDTQLQLVLELVEGGELFEHLVEHGPYSEATAALHIRDVTRAIAFLHSQNIVHRDLKPENILLTSKDDTARVKVADFGLAKLMFADVTRTVCGTWAYCAYEVKKPGGAYDNKCDVWSIGVIAFILLSAYHPFDPQGDATDDEIWERISRCDYNFNDPAWDNVSASAKDFVSRLLVLDPKKRMSAEEALQHPWLNAISENVQDTEALPALSPRINDKLASYQKRAAMNPLQRAAMAMRQRVSSWKTSSQGGPQSSGSSGSAGNTSPSWARRNLVIAAVAAAAAARAAARKGGAIPTPTNSFSEKGRTWSMGSSGRNVHAGSQGGGSMAESFSESVVSPSNASAGAGALAATPPFAPSPLRTASLAPQPTNETLLVPPTPTMADTQGKATQGGLQEQSTQEVPGGIERAHVEAPNSPVQAISALRVAETGDDATVRTSDLDTISSEDEDDQDADAGHEDTLDDEDADEGADEHSPSFASAASAREPGFESFKTAKGEDNGDIRSVEDV
jgi:calcium/calmodulin-dependent protein kinase-4